jgi:hypothetical protein
MLTGLEAAVWRGHFGTVRGTDQAFQSVRLHAVGREMFGSGNPIHQRADGVYADPDFVPALQREGVWRNDTGAGQQKATIREAVITEKVFD